MVSTAPAVQPVVDQILAEEARLYRLARRLTRCEADAEDLVQDTMLRAFRARDRFEPGTSMRAWTATILRRVFLTDAIRARRRGLVNDTDAGGPLAGVCGTASPETGDRTDGPGRPSFHEHVDDDVSRALGRVPPLYLTPFLLAALDGLSCAEIARRLDVPEGTVMSRIHRARERLRRDLRDKRPAAKPSLRVLPGDTPARRRTAAAG